jgi:hypothetical protein
MASASLEGLWSEAALAKAGDPIWEVTGAKGSQSVAHVVESMRGKFKVLNSNSSTAKNKTKILKPNSFCLRQVSIQKVTSRVEVFNK